MLGITCCGEVLCRTLDLVEGIVSRPINLAITLEVQFLIWDPLDKSCAISALMGIPMSFREVVVDGLGDSYPHNYKNEKREEYILFLTTKRNQHFERLYRKFKTSKRVHNYLNTFIP